MKFFRTQPFFWLLPSVLIAALIGCGNNRFAWEEEVQLQNGEIIIVKRKVEAKALGEVGGPGGWNPTYMRVEIIKPKKLDDPPAWETNSGFVPILFDHDPVTDEWVMIATFYLCQPWYEIGRPNLPYTEFRVRNSQWQRRDLSAQFVGRQANMLTNISSKGEPNHTVESKKKIMSDPAIAPKYQKIVGHWSTGC